jgi:hypothetical protein
MFENGYESLFNLKNMYREYMRVKFNEIPLAIPGITITR